MSDIEMREICLDHGWRFGYGGLSYQNYLTGQIGEKTVDLPHDYMVEGDVSPDAPSGRQSGYYHAGRAYYSKVVKIPADWKDQEVFLSFDGVMQNAEVEINQSRAAVQHYGYIPFSVNITKYLYFGETNRITVMVNPGMEPNSRWYAGAGIFRSVRLVVKPRLYLAEDGIYAYTDHIACGADSRPSYAVLKIFADLRNDGNVDHLADVTAQLRPDPAWECTAGENQGTEAAVIRRTQRVQVSAGSSGSALISMTVPDPALWSAENPALYRLKVTVKDVGEFRTHPGEVPEDTPESTDWQEILFGIRTILVDRERGLQINGRSVKLKGGCLHHDNGVIGAASLYDAEYRKMKKMKEAGYNAIRTSHYPPSAALLDACDRLGIYVMDEAFDMWGMPKNNFDYHLFFDTDWKKDLTAYIRRDRSRACVILWSTGNEIPEHGGLGEGYALAPEIAETVRSLDHTRPVTHALCSYFMGLDEKLLQSFQTKAGSNAGAQNADVIKGTFEEYSWPFVNGLDLVGYNYQDGCYEPDHERYPERVIVGTETFPRRIGTTWALVEKHPYIIGDFTWTAWDYIGEAGIGVAGFVPKENDSTEELENRKRRMRDQNGTYPWRLANDADFDINGDILPQGIYRRIVWGSPETAVFSYDPENFGKMEIVGGWGFTEVLKRWTWNGAEGKPVQVAVFSAAPAVELFVNGKSVGTKMQGEAPADEMPDTFVFDTVYEPGEIRAVSLDAEGAVISEDTLETVGKASAIRLVPEKTECIADGHSLIYVGVEITDALGRLIPDAAVPLEAKLSCGAAAGGPDGGSEAAEDSEVPAVLAGFGSANPVTDENYQSGWFTSYHGRALAVIRSGYAAGCVKLTVHAEAYGDASVDLWVK